VTPSRLTNVSRTPSFARIVSSNPPSAGPTSWLRWSRSTARGVFGIRYKGDQTTSMPTPRPSFRAHPEKLVGFMSVHPEEADVVAGITRCVTELGLQGIKLGPNYQGFDPLGAEARLVYATAQRMGLPIVFHQGTSPVRSAPVRYAHPLVMDEVAMAFPELRIVMAHIGHPWHADTIAVIRSIRTSMQIVSANFYRPWQLYHGLRLATEWNVLEKLVFGSDYPVATPRETLEGTLAVNRILDGTSLPRVPEDALRAALEREHPGIARHFYVAGRTDGWAE